MFSGVVTGDIQSLIETNSRLSSQTTRQRSEDMIHKQLSAFERLLLHSISRFSKENLYHLLRRVTRWAQDEEAKISNGVIISAFKLKSINQLKEQVTSMKEKRTHKVVEDDHVFKYYDLFLNDLLYLKDLKKYFDDEIYKSLMKYHYDPSVGKNNDNERSKEAKAKSKTNVKGRYVSHNVEDEDSGRGSQADSGDNRKTKTTKLGQRKKAKTDSVSTDAAKRYRDTVCELQDILRKWDGLLSEGILDLNDFDPDSYHELMQFTNYSQFEAVLRLVPDIFAKCYKCIDLAKVWLRESNSVLKDIPLSDSAADAADKNKSENQSFNEQQATTREFIKQVREIKSQLNGVEKSIEHDERRLEQYKREMNQLAGRDERFSKLTSEFNKMDSMLTLAAGKYQKSKSEQFAVASKLRGCRKDSYDYTEIKGKLKKIDKEVSENHWKMKLLEFEKSMIEEDYIVESGVRPSFIRFIGDTKDKMHDIQEGVQAKKEEKLRLDKQLALMKTNTERMRKIMRTYLGSAETKAGPALDRESTISSQPSDADIDDLSEYFLEDGNEADVDSAGPYDNSPGRYEAVEEDSSRRTGNQTPRLYGNSIGRYESVRPISVSINREQVVFGKKNVEKEKPRPSSFRIEKLNQSKDFTDEYNSQNKEIRKRSDKQTFKVRRVWENI